MSPLLLKLFSYAKDLQCSYNDFSLTLKDLGNLLHLSYLLRRSFDIIVIEFNRLFLVRCAIIKRPWQTSILRRS